MRLWSESSVSRSRRGRGCAIALLLLVVLAGCNPEREPETTLDGIYTSEQAERGAGLFAQHCARCHSIQEFSGPMFETVWTGTPAAALYMRIANTMPMDQPGSLGNSQITALMAHIFASNDMPTGSAPLTADLEWLTGITIVRSE